MHLVRAHINGRCLSRGRVGLSSCRVTRFGNVLTRSSRSGRAEFLLPDRGIGTFSPRRSLNGRKAACLCRPRLKRLATRSTCGSVGREAHCPPAARLGNHLFRTLYLSGRVHELAHDPSSFFHNSKELDHQRSSAELRHSSCRDLKAPVKAKHLFRASLQKDQERETCGQGLSLQPLHYAWRLAPVARPQGNRRFMARAQVRWAPCSWTVTPSQARQSVRLPTLSIVRNIRAAADRFLLNAHLTHPTLHSGWQPTIATPSIPFRERVAFCVSDYQVQRTAHV
jgi:hypothetical protein